MTEDKPFSFTGLDYLGPLFITTADKQQAKVWVCLFTCGVTRAVHLELVSDMTAQEFLMTFQRFVSCRGLPKLVVSDNAKQFKTAKTALDRLWHLVITHPTVATYTAEHGVRWKFITERAPWMGGFYERLVGTVKRALKIRR